MSVTVLADWLAAIPAQGRLHGPKRGHRAPPERRVAMKTALAFLAGSVIGDLFGTTVGFLAAHFPAIVVHLPELGH
jgi:hypothetical protein